MRFFTSSRSLTRFWSSVNVYSVLSLLPSGKHFKINYGCKFDQLLWQVLNFEAQLSAGVYNNVQSTKEAENASTDVEASKELCI